jgi:hypothetical protein
LSGLRLLGLRHVSLQSLSGLRVPGSLRPRCEPGGVGTTER